MHPLLEFLNRRGFHPGGDLSPGLRIDHVTEVSSQCRAGSLFIAIQGAKADGHAYLDDAARRGAAAALVTRVPPSPPAGLALLRVDDTRRAAGPVAQEIMGNPSRRLDLVGVTGTNGKTTTVYLMEALLKAAGRKPGIITTVVNRWADKEVVSDETTPSGPALARRLAEMVGDSVDSAAMEVSSHAIDQRRVDGLRFRAMALTNVTQDHLDYHKTMEEYAATKAAIFSRMREENPEAIGVVNLDDPTGAKIAASLNPENRITFALDAEAADLRAEALDLSDRGLELTTTDQGKRIALRSPLQGRFNAANILTATGLALALELPIEAIERGVGIFRGAPGRFEMVEGLTGIRIIVDYAHTPDALVKLLTNARPLARRRLVAVFGCGGDRDRTKRPKMGRAAAELADEVIVTSDNPRTEDPELIAAQIVEGIEALSGARAPHRTILNRREAIGAAIALAEEGDTIVIAGKGHEDYQILGKEKIHFDDREVAREAIAQRVGGPRRDAKDRESRMDSAGIGSRGKA